MEDWEWEKIGRVFFHRAFGAPFLDFWVAIADLGRESRRPDCFGVFLFISTYAILYTPCGAERWNRSENDDGKENSSGYFRRAVFGARCVLYVGCQCDREN